GRLQDAGDDRRLHRLEADARHVDDGVVPRFDRGHRSDAHPTRRHGVEAAVRDVSGDRCGRRRNSGADPQSVVRQLVVGRSLVVGAARVANTLFFLLTSAYCLLTLNSFAYQQFVRPHLIASLTGFVVWHGLLFWIALLVTTASMMPWPERPA